MIVIAGTPVQGCPSDKRRPHKLQMIERGVSGGGK
jgi:hypothetical protein